VPVDEVAELLRRWREAGGAWGRGRVLLDAAQLAGRLTPEERRVVAASLADTGAPDLARQLETRTGQPVDARHLQAFADGLLDLEGARLDDVIAALEVAEERLTDEAASETAPTDGATAATPDPASAQDGMLPPPPPPARRDEAVTQQEEALDERLRDLAVLEHLGDEELQGIRLGEIELGSQELGGQDLGGQDLDEAGLGEVGLGEVELGEVSLGVAPAIGGVAATAAPPPGVAATAAPPAGVAPDGPDDTPDRPEAERGPGTGTADAPDDVAVSADTAAPDDRARTDDSPAPDDRAEPTSIPAPGREPDATALVPATSGAGPLASQQAADALALISGRLAQTSTAAGRLTALSDERTRDLDAPAALLVLDQVPAGWQRRRAARRLLASGALADVDPAALLARFPDARDRRFVAADLLAASDLAAEDLVDELPPQVVRRLAIRAER
jgi:hypothetical protein